MGLLCWQAILEIYMKLWYVEIEGIAGVLFINGKVLIDIFKQTKNSK